VPPTQYFFFPLCFVFSVEMGSKEHFA
jgi:hypothetical protein